MVGNSFDKFGLKEGDSVNISGVVSVFVSMSPTGISFSFQITVLKAINVHK